MKTSSILEFVKKTINNIPKKIMINSRLEFSDLTFQDIKALKIQISEEEFNNIKSNYIKKKNIICQLM